MRGNKFYIKLCLMFTILCLGIVSVFAFIPTRKIEGVKAEDNSIYNNNNCSQKYNDDIVFSVEQVYYQYGQRSVPLTYDNIVDNKTSNILGYGNADNYFANFGGTNDNVAKKIIRSGEYAMLDEDKTINVYQHKRIGDTVEVSSVSLNQGIMISLGGYIYDTITKELKTNSEIIPASDPALNYSADIKSMSINLSRNGEVINSDANLRTYYNSSTALGFDFVYFLDAIPENEGHYEIDINYTLEGSASVNHKFDFYLLLQSSYTKDVEINSQVYTTFPTIAYYGDKSGETYNQVINPDNTNYPVLTYDYKHFDLVFSYSCNDLIVNNKVSYEYQPNDGINRIKIESTTNKISETIYYACESNNNIISFVFPSIGKYNFNFKYVYYDGNDRLVVDNLKVEDKVLNIFGYNLKYAKTGYSSSDLRSLDIVKNGTVVVPFNGYVDDALTSSNTDTNLGYMYNFVNPTGNTDPKKSGDIFKKETADCTKTLSDFNTSCAITADGKLTFTDSSIYDFVNTDQGGLWLALNDEYALENSYYWHSPTPFLNSVEYTGTKLTKVTTYTRTGYYFVKAGYTNDATTITQYFAFRIKSAAANVKLYATDEVAVPTSPTAQDVRLYSNQFTNKNVFADWADPSTFESKQTAILYSANRGHNVYQSKDSLLNYANGASNVAITKQIFDKNDTLLTENGSYLLMLSVNGTQTKSYYYFVIDKENISGIEVLGVSAATIGTNLVYDVAKDSSNNAITYTNKALIDKNFTMWWNNKASGAIITGSYTFTPIVYDASSKETISGTDGIDEYVWIPTTYKLGTTSNKISIDKPSTMLSTVSADNVLTKQGIYWFDLVDQAGNQMSYMVVIDRTEISIEASTENIDKVASGDMVAEPITFDWGTHKLIDLNKNTDGVWTTIYNEFVLNNNSINYYSYETKTNINEIKNTIRAREDGANQHLYFVVKNQYATVTNTSLGGNNVYSLINNGSFSYTGNWKDSLGRDIINKINGHNLTINLRTQETNYTIKVYGQNSVNNQTNSTFKITLNPDQSQGVVKSTTDLADESISPIKVNSYNDVYNETDFKKNYTTGQATNDKIMIFEWLPGEGTVYEVSDVYYDYYPLMTQLELNSYTRSSAYDFYPYSSNKTTYYIYGGAGNAQYYKPYTVGGTTMFQSLGINPGYIMYYENGNLASMNATLPGMYVITREYKNDIELENDSKIRKYTFFVDRNGVIEYSTSDMSVKTVGQYIDVLSQEKVVFNNFTQKVNTVKMGDQNYNIYLESNRLPLEIRIPTGKYISYNNGIIHTSNSISGGLKLNIYFVDDYNYLNLNNNGAASFKLFEMNDMMMSANVYVDEGYIIYKLSPDSLYMGENNFTTKYLTACAEVNKTWLSLPGSYIIEASDNVGKISTFENANVMQDCNKLRIGVKILQENPIVNLYSSRTTDNNTNVVYANFNETNTIFTTSKAYVRYELPKENLNSFDAQIDKSYIYITRQDNGVSRLYYNSENNSGIINTDTRFEGINYIQTLEDGSKCVWLDTGLTIQEGKIVDYQEYSYTIKVRYILGTDNKYLKSYVYYFVNRDTNTRSEENNFYENTFKVIIDRTAFLSNLEDIVDGEKIGEETTATNNQIPFLTDYVKGMADEHFSATGKLDSKIYNTVAYRGEDGEDYYAVVNKLYYYYVEKGEYDKAENAIYSILIDKDAEIKISTDGSTNNIYYRKLYTENLTKNRRMALLPTCSKYYQNITDFATFNTSSFDSFNMVLSSSDLNWGTALRFSENGQGYYEIIEVDNCGNFTQYIVFCVDIDENNVATTYNPTLSFKDALTNESNGLYTMSFNFVNTEDNSSIFNYKSKANVLTQVDGVVGLETITSNSIALITLQGIEDMFGNKSPEDGSPIDAIKDISRDLSYKISIQHGNTVITSYQNYNNYNLTDFIYNNFRQIGNYTFTITNRYNVSLTSYINVLDDDNTYKLNIDNFKAFEQAEGSGEWIIKPSFNLNSVITKENVTFSYYASKIVLKNLSDTTVANLEYIFNNKGECISLNGEPLATFSESISLIRDTVYYATITDCANKTYTKRLYTYNNEQNKDHSLSVVGESSVINNKYYTTNEVDITFNNTIFTSQKVTILKNGQTICSSRDLGSGFRDTSFNYYEVITNNTNQQLSIIRFYPYINNGNNSLTDMGALLEITVDLMFMDEITAYSFIIDNRMPLITLINTNGEDKTNIINAKFDYDEKDDKDSSKDDKVILSNDILFDITPSLTLSETVVLGWNNFNINDYVDTGYYFNGKVLLYEFVTKNNPVITTGLELVADKYITLKPDENSLGRYVLVVALYTNMNTLLSYKAFAFNISSTANAMYEVQDTDGNGVLYYSSTTGKDIVATDGTAVFDFDNIKGLMNWDDDLDTKYINFKNQNIPIYISNQVLNVIPNGDNGIQAQSVEKIINEYTVLLYRIYSDVHTTYVVILKVAETQELIDVNAETAEIRFVTNQENDGDPITTPLFSAYHQTVDNFGKLYFKNFYQGSIATTGNNAGLSIAQHNKLYLEVYYKYSDNNIVRVTNTFGSQYEDAQNTNYVDFVTSGTYLIYLKDLAGNVRMWGHGTVNESEYLTFTILPEVVVTINGEVPVEYAFYNSEVTVAVSYMNAGYYDNSSVQMFAYLNGSSSDYITGIGGRKTNLVNAFTFKDYGTYRVEIKAKRGGADIPRVVVFSIINPTEARLALDFTSVSKYDITKVINTTTKADVTDTFNFLINEGFIYSKLITYDRLSAENAFGSTMGKQSFTVFYTASNDPLVPERDLSFVFTINNQTPSMKSSIKPGGSTTKNITIRFNPQTIYRQVGDCYIMVNDTVVMSINSETAYDSATTISIKDVGKYYVKIVSDSGRVMSSFKVTIKEPLNTWSIILIVGAVLLVVGIIVTFIVLRTKMKVR